MQKDPISVRFNQDGSIGCSYRAYHKKSANGKISWFIPGFNIRFNSDTHEAGMERAAKMIKYFAHSWLNKGSFREFVLEIHRLGFRSPSLHDLTISKLIKRELHKAQFNSLAIVPDNADYNSTEINIAA